MQKAIFVVGTGRCGTSWMQRWLLQHPQIAGVYNETKLFELLGTIVCYPQKINFESKIPRLHKWLTPDRLADLAGEFAYNLLNEVCMDQQKNYVVEKTPRHFWWTESINRFLSTKCEVYFVHIYRDGRNVIESFLRQDWSPNISFVTGQWIAAMNHMIEGECPNNMIHVKYEDLIADKSKSRAITKFCSIPHHHDIEAFDESLNASELSFDPNRWEYLKRYDLIRKYYDQMAPTLVKLGYLKNQ